MVFFVVDPSTGDLTCAVTDTPIQPHHRKGSQNRPQALWRTAEGIGDDSILCGEDLASIPLGRFGPRLWVYRAASMG
jgi:hypothetical protein